MRRRRAYSSKAERRRKSPGIGSGGGVGEGRERLLDRVRVLEPAEHAADDAVEERVRARRPGRQYDVHGPAGVPREPAGGLADRAVVEVEVADHLALERVGVGDEVRRHVLLAELDEVARVRRVEAADDDGEV